MKWTLNWLKSYLDTEASAQEIADKLTEIGLEIESFEPVKSPIIAKIIEASDIPETHLHLLKVDDGTGILRQVVCGAPNARAGLTSVLALPGTIIQGHEIKVGKIRGFESNGMMCSEKELGLSDNHEGITELDSAKYKLGAKFFETNDVVFDATITPNRSDYLSVIGIARDLAAAGLGKLKNITKTQNNKSGNGRIAIIKSDACSVYNFTEIHNIKLSESDSVISSCLSLIGINPRNAAIDATNYICYDMGQPMHSFDADKVIGNIVIRNAILGEKFTDLFGIEHNLIETDLVVADDNGVIAIAGVIGGKRTATTDETKNIILEAAYFDSISVRKTRTRLGLNTDASFRFERGIDSTISFNALNFAKDIILKQCGGTVVQDYFAGVYPKVAAIPYNSELFKKKTGIDLPARKQIKILQSLEFFIDVPNRDDIEHFDVMVIPHPARVDIKIPENIVSEIIRIYGYHNIKTADKNIKINLPKISKIKSDLAALGYNEITTYGFGSSHKEKILSNIPNIKVKNPIIDTFDTARNGLTQNILDVIADNDRFKRSNLALFELGTVFDGYEPGEQHQQLILARTGIYGDKIGIKHGNPVSIYDLKNDILKLYPGVIFENDKNPELWAHPYRSAIAITGGKVIAKFGELIPSIAKKFGIKTPAVIAIIQNPNEDFMVDFPIIQKSNYNMSEFPLITRDFAFITNLSEQEIVSVAKSADTRIMEVNVFDKFQKDNNTSVAFEIVIQPENNIGDSELQDLQNKVISVFENNGAVLRK